MNDQTLELLERLADKFGTTAEHLWEVLLRQAPIAAGTEFAITVALCLIWVCAFRLVLSKTTCPEVTETNRYPKAEWHGEGAGVAWVLLGFGLGILMVLVYTTATTAITVLFNPEYWALKQVLP